MERGRGREGRREGCRWFFLARRGEGGGGRRGGGGGNCAIATLFISFALLLFQLSLFCLLCLLLPFLLLFLLLPLLLSLYLFWRHVPDVKFANAFVVAGDGAAEEEGFFRDVPREGRREAGRWGGRDIWVSF